jgi:hypothetical protein
MPLAFDERQLLVAGVHDATLAEVEQHFARFQRTDRRMNLFKKLNKYGLPTSARSIGSGAKHLAGQWMQSKVW